jgi:hypothetical protein
MCILLAEGGTKSTFPNDPRRDDLTLVFLCCSTKLLLLLLDCCG